METISPPHFPTAKELDGLSSVKVSAFSAFTWRFPWLLGRVQTSEALHRVTTWVDGRLGVAKPHHSVVAAWVGGANQAPASRCGCTGGWGSRSPITPSWLHGWAGLTKPQRRVVAARVGGANQAPASRCGRTEWLLGQYAGAHPTWLAASHTLQLSDPSLSRSKA